MNLIVVVIVVVLQDHHRNTPKDRSQQSTLGLYRDPANIGVREGSGTGSIGTATGEKRMKPELPADAWDDRDLQRSTIGVVSYLDGLVLVQSSTTRQAVDGSSRLQSLEVSSDNKRSRKCLTYGT